MAGDDDDCRSMGFATCGELVVRSLGQLGAGLGEVVLLLTTSLPLLAKPASATPPVPKRGCGALISARVRCSKSVGSCASGCAAGLFRRGPVARPPMNAAREIGSDFPLEEVVLDVLEGFFAMGGGVGAASPVNFRSASDWFFCLFSGVLRAGEVGDCD